jgi:hypothetical protein
MSSIFDGMAALFVETFGDVEPFSYALAAGGPSVAITAILETPAALVSGLAEADVVTAETELHAAAADLPAGYGEGDTVVARGVTYRTRVPMPDGRGMVRIPLQKL